MKEVLRFVLRVLCTAVAVTAFSLPWAGMFLVVGCVFMLSDFVENVKSHPFTWREHLAECNDFFIWPLRTIWGLEEKKR